jgi:putative ABC transport system substrate-binding protein
MMRRREFIALLGTAALGGLLPANAQQPAKMHRVGVMLAGTPVADAPNVAKGLVQGLHALGYVESKNLVLEWRSAEGRYERLPELSGPAITSSPEH